MEYHYDIISKKLNLQTLHIRRHHIDALFLIHAFCGTKYCPSVLETVGLRVPTRNTRNFTTFSCSFSHCPSARCVSAANAVCKSVDTYIRIFRKSCWSLNGLSWFIMFVFLFFTLLFCPVSSYFVVVLCWLCNWPLAVEFSTLINKELNWIELLPSLISYSNFCAGLKIPFPMSPWVSIHPSHTYFCHMSLFVVSVHPYSSVTRFNNNK
jgi:hypothetical protein